MKNRDLLSPIVIDNLSSLERAIDEALEKFGLVEPLWRGHSSIDWSLRAEVFRDGPYGPYDEASLIRSFMTRAESRSSRCPPFDDRVAWLMLARHYGLPTRLMDWSQSPLTALYFAALQDRVTDTQDGCIWALQAGQLNEAMGGPRALMPFENATVRKFVNCAFLTRSDQSATEQREALRSQALAIGSREIDMRILVQQGAFTIHGDGADLCDVAPVALRAFRIRRESKENIRQRLRHLGFHRATLFPDLGALAEELKSRDFRPA
jgi:hypothetical protein